MPDIPFGKDFPDQPWIDRDGEPMDEAPPSLLGGMVSGDWLDAQDFPPLAYAVPGIIPEGFGLLVGPPKAGKSWLVADIGLAVAFGGKALGSIDVESRPVLYLALEDGYRRLQSRFRRITAEQPIPPRIGVVITAESHEVIPMIAEFVQRHADKGPLIILDTLGRAKPPRRPGEDPYSMDYAYGTRLKEAVDAVQGATLLVVHHSRKAESADFVDAVSGTHGIAGAADFVIVLARKRHCNDAILAVTGRDITEAEYAVMTDAGLWRLDGADLASAARRATERRDDGKLGDRALEVLSLVNTRTQTRAADLKVLGIAPEQARVYLNRLADSGRIRKVGRGVYGSASTDDDSAFNGADTSCVTTVMSVTSADRTENVTVVTDVTDVGHLQ